MCRTSSFPSFRPRLLSAFLALTPLVTGTLHAQGSGYWHTSGNKILDSNNAQVRIAGINWYGFETTRAVAGGLTSQDYKFILQNIRSLGYNTVRIPLSNQMVESPSYPSISYYNNTGPINSDLQGLNSLQILDKIVSYAGSIGVKVILDNHRSEAGDSAEANGLWFTGSYPESAWINDWAALANRYLNNPTVIGVDLRNEPHNAFSGGACWDCGGANDWHLAAQRAGNAVLGVNPKLLIFVEGTDAYTSSDYYWWGGNLEGVSRSPVTLAVPNQLVYSAHDYGPFIYNQPWFNGSTSASSLSSVWTQHWAFIAKNNIAPVWLGEFGTPNDAASVQSSQAGSEGQWFQSLVGFLAADNTLNWTYWALNGEDSLALLDNSYDASPVSSQKQSALATIQFALNGGSATTTPAPGAPSGLAASAASASSINLSWTASPTRNVSYTVYEGSSAIAANLTATSYAVTGLTASTTYSFTVRAVSSSGGTASAASNQATATTQPAPAPSAPSNLNAATASSSQINLTWAASSTAGVTYSLYSGASPGSANTLLASGVSGTTYSATGLAASTTYYFTVKAVSGGTASAASSQASATTQAAPAGGACHVAYSDQNDWGSGFTGGLSITTSAAVSSWTLTWSYTGNQLLNQSWNSNYTQSGKTVTLTNAGWNGSIAAGATLTGIGWNANYSGSNPNPTVFYLNGVRCQ